MMDKVNQLEMEIAKAMFLYHNSENSWLMISDRVKDDWRRMARIAIGKVRHHDTHGS
jgi:putative AlgH/UPF0301 family transcriptional regulator